MMTVEIIEALAPKIQEPPPIRPIVLKWRTGSYDDWERVHYYRVDNESHLGAARREALDASKVGYHVRILTVDEKP